MADRARAAGPDPRHCPGRKSFGETREADKLDLVHPKQLLAAARKAGRPGARLRVHLERQTFKATDSELEREFLRLIRGTEIPPPETQQRIGRFRVDFHWPDLRLVVETDGGRFHRTPSQIEKDRRLDQEMARRGLELLRLSHPQVFYDKSATLALLADVVTKQRAARAQGDVVTKQRAARARRV